MAFESSVHRCQSAAMVRICASAHAPRPQALSSETSSASYIPSRIHFRRIDGTSEAMPASDPGIRKNTFAGGENAAAVRIFDVVPGPRVPLVQRPVEFAGKAEALVDERRNSIIRRRRVDRPLRRVVVRREIGVKPGAIAFSHHLVHFRDVTIVLGRLHRPNVDGRASRSTAVVFKRGNRCHGDEVERVRRVQFPGVFLNNRHELGEKVRALRRSHRRAGR